MSLPADAADWHARDAALRARLAALMTSLREMQREPRAATMLERRSSVDAASEELALRRLAARTEEELAALRKAEAAPARHAVEQAAKADPLRAAIARLQAKARPAVAARAATGPGLGVEHGAVVPVAGPVVTRFGQPTVAGPATGMNYAPSASAPVTAPCRGRVDFAGPFRSFGTMVILDCGRGWRFVLAGLGRVEVRPGVAVRAGEMLGRMPDGGANGGKATLYVQLRHGETTVDPGRVLPR